MIDPAIIAHVKSATDLSALVAQRGSCPRGCLSEPQVSRGYFFCQTCRAAGSVIDWLMLTEGLSFHQAVRALAGRLERCAEFGEPK